MACPPLTWRLCLLTVSLVLALLVTSASLSVGPARRPPSGKDQKPGPAAFQKGDLVRAVLRGDEAAVRSLLRRGADPNENLGSEKAPITPLFAALALEEAGIARLLVGRASGLELRRTYRGHTAMDFASFWKQEKLAQRLAAELPTPRERAADKPDPDRAAWVANGLAVLAKDKDSGTALGLAHIAAAYEGGAKGAVRAKTLREAARLRDEYRLRVKAGDGQPLTPAQVAEVAFHILGEGPRGRRLALAVVGSASRPAEALGGPAPFGILRSARQHALALSQFHEHALEHAYAAGRKDAGVGRAVEAFAGTTLKVRLGTPARDIVKNNPVHFDPAVLKLVETGAAPSAPEVRAYWAAVYRTIKETNRAALETNRAVLKLEERSDRAEELARLEQKYQTAESSVYLLKGLALAAGDPKLAQQIHTIGSAGIQIGRAVETFCKAKVLNKAVTLGSSVNLISAVFGGMLMLGSLFGSDADTLKEIYEQIVELRKEVEDLRLQMHERFNALDRRLNDVVTLLVHGFRSLEWDLALARDELRVVATQVSLLESYLLDLEPSFRNYLAVAADRAVWREVYRCLEWEGHQKGRLPDAEFTRALEMLRVAATREARDLLAVGRPLTEEELSDDSKLAARVQAFLKEGLDGNVGALQSLARRFDPRGPFGRARLGSLVRWALMAEAYVELASRYPDYYARCATAAGVDEMMQVGREWQESVASLKAKAEGADAPAALYARLLENYRAKAKLFREVVQSRVMKYEAEYVEGYDLWAGPHQVPRQGVKREAFGVGELPLSEGVDISKAALYTVGLKWKGGTHLKAPAALAGPDAAKGVIDPAFLIAHHLGLGEIKVRWTGPRAADERRSEPPPPAPLLRRKNSPWEDFIYIKPAVTIEARFVPAQKDAASRLIFKADVKGDQEFCFANQTFWPHREPKRLLGKVISVETNRRDGVRSTYGKDEIDAGQKTFLKYYQPELQKQWPGMRERALKGTTAKDVPAASLQAVRELVENDFKARREELERELRAGAKGRDAGLADALRQLSAAKAMLEAFVSLGLTRSVAERPELRELFAGGIMERGRTRLLDGALLDRLLARGGSLVDIARDAEWLDGPANRLGELLKNLPVAPEPQPQIEVEMKRLALLKKIHRSAQPKKSLEDAARELKQRVQELSKKLD